METPQEIRRARIYRFIALTISLVFHLILIVYVSKPNWISPPETGAKPDITTVEAQNRP